MNRIKLDKLLSSKEITTFLVLSTSHGKYVVKEWIQRWDPITDFFKNYFTAPIQSMRSNNKNSYYGADFAYLVKLLMEDGQVKTITVYSEDYNYPRFQNFKLTQESLISKDSLEDFIIDRSINGKISCVNVEVSDGRELLSKSYGSGFDKTIEAERYNWFTYLVIGTIVTKLSNFRLYFMNRKRRKDHNASR